MKKQTDISFIFDIVYLGAGRDFFNNVFINADVYKVRYNVNKDR